MRANTVSAVAGAKWLLHWTREFFGENDYPRYVAEWQARHSIRSAEPGHRLLTAREFFNERLRIRYGGGVNRCC